MLTKMRPPAATVTPVGIASWNSKTGSILPIGRLVARRAAAFVIVVPYVARLRPIIDAPPGPGGRRRPIRANSGRRLRSGNGVFRRPKIRVQLAKHRDQP